MPTGMTIELDAATRLVDNRTLLGGSPTRALRLSPTGMQVLREATSAPLETTRARRLARRLTDAGLAHPCPTERQTLSVTVVVPVRDRIDELAVCLAALGADYPVVVVDDGSANVSAVAAVAAEYGATLVRRDETGGPGAARNTGLAVVDSDVVAFLDSDCTPPAGWVDALVRHLHDPLVAAVAPRIVAAVVTSTAQRYATVAGSLDMGDRPALVAPGHRVSYVPTAALIVRRSALQDIASSGRVFDPSLRYGEDVDLVWRLHGRQWRVRYDPTVRVAHREPAGWRDLLVRRYHYGTSAAPLSRRHPGALAPLVIEPLAAGVIGAAIAGRPRIAIGGFVALVLMARRRTQGAGLNVNPVEASARGMLAASVGASRYLVQFAAPALLGVAIAGRAPAHRRLAVGTLLAPGIHGWFSRRPPLDPVRFTAATTADHLAYGAGVWSGCVRARTVAPLRPALTRRPSHAHTLPSTTRKS